MAEYRIMQDLIETLITRWVDAGKYAWPDLQDGASWICTEAGEALDEVLRLKSQYVRNNPKSFSMSEFMAELADVAIMCYVTAIVADQELDIFIQEKLSRMDKERRPNA